MSTDSNRTHSWVHKTRAQLRIHIYYYSALCISAGLDIKWKTECGEALMKNQFCLFFVEPRIVDTTTRPKHKADFKWFSPTCVLTLSRSETGLNTSIARQFRCDSEPTISFNIRNATKSKSMKLQCGFRTLGYGYSFPVRNWLTMWKRRRLCFQSTKWYYQQQGQMVYSSVAYFHSNSKRRSKCNWLLAYKDDCTMQCIHFCAIIHYSIRIFKKVVIGETRVVVTREELMRHKS